MSTGKDNILKTRVLVIGGGVTGAGIARDLSLRGVPCIVLERADLNAGASGANHGLLHSGARYIATDPKSARECAEENELLKQTTPQCIEPAGGLYIAVPGDDENYIADFPGRCSAAGVPARQLDLAELKEIEPAVSSNAIAAFQTKDASIDPFRLVLDNMAQAQSLGSTLLTHTAVTGFRLADNAVQTVQARNSRTGEALEIEAELVINAAGAWVGQVAGLAGINIDIVFSKGTLLVTSRRLTEKVILRLRAPADADALVPGGTVSLVGPTSVRLDNLDDIRPSLGEIDAIIDGSVPMVPSLEAARYIRAFSGVRPLIASQAVTNDRNRSRGFDLMEHGRDGVSNMITVAGGKLSIYRFMAEKLSDLVCEKLGVTSPCRTRTEILPSAEVDRWTEPGASVRQWFHQDNHDGGLLCECEMVSRSVVEQILDSLDERFDAWDLKALGLRSRLGKGACQGITCGLRAAAYLNERGGLDYDNTLAGLREFVRGRWKGERPVSWGTQHIQAELKEIIYCGFLGLQNDQRPPQGRAVR